MTDDGFHLTPHDIRSQEFQRAVRGYDRQHVDDFKERVAEELERLMRGRAQLEERIKNFQEQLRAFRDRERAMNEALLAAQQLRVEVEAQAGREAEAILREAKGEALRVVEEAKRLEQAVRDRTAESQRSFARYLTNLRALLERQMGELEGLEHHATSSAAASQGEMPLKKQA